MPQVGRLAFGCFDPVCVDQNASVQEALQIMIENDFSQLPVINARKLPIGLITYESIVKASQNFGLRLDQLHVSNAIANVKSFSLEEDLYDLLDQLKVDNAVLIDGADEHFGIVTTFDSTEFFRRRAEDMMRVEDIEGLVKEFILQVFTNDDTEIDQEKLATAIIDSSGVRKELSKKYKQAVSEYLHLTGQVNPNIDPNAAEKSFVRLYNEESSKEFTDLTLNEYIDLLLYKNVWDIYQQVFNIDIGAARHLLGGVRDTRNFLAHFHGEITSAQREQLKFCVDWLERCKTQYDRKVIEEVIQLQELLSDAARIVNEIKPVDEFLSQKESRYAPLAINLNAQSIESDSVTFSFKEIEMMIDGDLPASAREHRTWWANDPESHSQSQQWLDVGWRVSQVNILEEKVTFTRIKAREKKYIQFFGALQAKIRKIKGFPFKDVSPDGHSWIVLASLPPGKPQRAIIACSFTRGGRLRLELYIDTGDKKINKKVFDLIATEVPPVYERLDNILWGEAGGRLLDFVETERMDDRRASRIATYKGGSIDGTSEELKELQDWVADNILEFYKIIGQPAITAINTIEG